MSALPEWHERVECRTIEDYYAAQYSAAIARLRVASNRGYLQHLDWCPAADPVIGPILNCECGLEELLADLLPPGEGR